MRRRTLGVKKEPSIMIIPMIDIMFFLLVFFMVSSLYMNREQQIPVQLPATSSAPTKVLNPVIITITTGGNLYVDKDAMDSVDIPSMVMEKMSANPRQVFVVRADKGVLHNDVVTLIDTLKTSGAKQISIATDRK